MAEIKKRIPRVTIEGVRILGGPFKNFSGRGDQYNREGDRHFTIEVPENLIEPMRNDGWQIKELAPREEGDTPTPILKVKVSYNPKAQPPDIVLVKMNRRTTLEESMVDTLDYLPMKNVDLIIHPYAWDVNGKQGVTAYLHKMFITVDTDELDAKYADIPEDTPTYNDEDDAWDPTV